MKVIDASVLAAFIRKEPGWERLVVFVKLCTTIDLAVKEVLNTIWRDYSVRKTISIDQAVRLREILLSMIGINVLIEPEGKYISKGFEIALKTGTTVYDALYIALAAEKNLPLITLDKKQAKASEDVGVKAIIPSV
ncbi:type II toxin-antitoxin system VapC family toxin [Fervidicoccus fontis]|uniref:type II toxin-antitoxin system VapC family toxin n=1 Tax=Fervidicoccus fontis TaxID=683846 RepID=UPI0011E4E4E9|nr:type II toxin-antitoxin system VapC family toxin [Fervidicoccus fontis]